jgi:hypothetical protein
LAVLVGSGHNKMVGVQVPENGNGNGIFCHV